DPTKAKAYVDQVAQARLQAAQAAGEVAQEKERLASQFAETEAKYQQAWKSALEAGWSESELKRLGLTKPAAVRGARTGSRRKRSDAEQTIEVANSTTADDGHE